MKRIVIIGSSGAGKSTLARELGQKLNLPVTYLDKHFWHPGWVGTPHSEWRAIVRELATREAWIIDGNYRSTLNTRLQAADTIIFLDLPRWLCAWRAVKRRLKYLNHPRPDMAAGCEEKILDPKFVQFLQWIWDYPNRARPDVVQRLTSLDYGQRIVWLRSTAEVKRFLERPFDCHPRINLVDSFYEYYANENRNA